MTSIVIESTAIGPQSLLSRRSNIVTEIVLVFAVNSRIVADSSRIEPMKIRIQVAMTPLRIERRGDVDERAQPSGAEDAARVLELRVHRLERRRDLLVADGKLLRQVREEDDPQRPVQHERRLRVAQEQPDRQHDARDRHRRGREEREIAMAPDEFAQAQVADDRDQDRADRGRGDTEHERVDERRLRLAELEEDEAPMLEREVADDRRRTSSSRTPCAAARRTAARSSSPARQRTAPARESSTRPSRISCARRRSCRRSPNSRAGP